MGNLTIFSFLGAGFFSFLNGVGFWENFYIGFDFGGIKKKTKKGAKP